MRSKKRGFSNRGVSPVIGVILMLAITVVLASVVYYMIQSIGGTDPESMRVGTIAEVDKNYNQTAVKCKFTSFVPDTKPSEISVSIHEEGDTFNILEYDDATSSFIGTGSTYTVTYHDQTGNDYINFGDYILIDGLQRGEYYEVIIFEDESGDVLDEEQFKKG